MDKGPITRADLIEKCIQFLKGSLKSTDIESYASYLIFHDLIWEDDRVSHVIFQWDNPEIIYPITKQNITLWKHYLETGEDLLEDYNFWNVHIDRQKEICKKYQSPWHPINKKLIVGCSKDLDSNPIHGLRLPKVGHTTGWYIYSGEYSEKDDFYQPICAEHLLQMKPEIIRYLGLDVGYRFLIDNQGYEDVWYDAELKTIQ